MDDVTCSQDLDFNALNTGLTGGCDALSSPPPMDDVTRSQDLDFNALNTGLTGGCDALSSPPHG